MKEISQGPKDTQRIARQILDNLTPQSTATVLALSGDLGAGKTNFAQVVGEMLGVKENMHSPTFVIEKIYDINWKGFQNLIHIDSYRIEKDSELLHLGWEEIVKEPENLILIEWPENVSKLIPQDAKRVSFKHINENSREITYEG
jgi:tRNA threonylcarbamoyladenosine biosynthesis protein TsaE